MDKEKIAMKNKNKKERNMTSHKKKSHSTLFQNSKNGLFERVFDNQRLAIKQCYQTGNF